MFYTCIGIEANRVDAFPEVTSTLFYQAKTKGHHLHLWYIFLCEVTATLRNNDNSLL
eukprot:m.54901 g.54901  ORF g.54901 m.54901 type:complete len:57 (+) comp7731_c1_seq9:1425-1595(+)